MRVPLLMLVLEGAFHRDTGVAFTLSSVVPPQYAPTVLHLCVPAVIYLGITSALLELKLFNFILAARPGSRLPPYSFVWSMGTPPSAAWGHLGVPFPLTVQ